MYPSLLITKPEPRLLTVRGVSGIRNCRKKSLKGSWPGLGAMDVGPDSTRLVLMFTTAGLSSAARFTHTEVAIGTPAGSARSLHSGDGAAGEARRGPTTVPTA